MKRKIQLSAALAASAVATAVMCNSALSSDEHRERAQTNYVEADFNQDGLLDLDEFTTFVDLNADYGIGRTPMIRRFGMHGTAFERLDTNKDKLVSREELAAGSEQ